MLVDGTMRYIRRFQNRINAIEGLTVLGKPDMSLFAYTSTTMDIYAIATGMEDRGWMVSKDSVPFKAIHFMQSPGHEPYVDAYLSDLEDVVELVASGKRTRQDARKLYIEAFPPGRGGNQIRIRPLPMVLTIRKTKDSAG